MRMVTSARVRAVGFLLLEVATVALLVMDRFGKDPALKASIRGLIKKARAL
jgi:hypothetical protein